MIAPTGGGKSIAFQSLVLSNPNVIILVITPVTALMKDQVCSDSGRFQSYPNVSPYRCNHWHAGVFGHAMLLPKKFLKTLKSFETSVMVVIP